MNTFTNVKLIILKKLLTSEFGKNIATLFTGTLIAQSIPIVVSPILSRIYTPEDFAINEIFLRFFSIGLVFSTLRYEQAIVLPKTHKKSALIIKLILKISIITSFVFLLFNFIFGKLIENSQNIPNLHLYLYILPVALFISSNYQSLNYWNIRNKAYKKISFAKGFISSSNSIYRVILGMITSGHPIVLISSTIFSQLVGFFLLLKGNLKTISSFFKNSNNSEVKAIATEYIDFPKINTFHALLDASRDAIIIYIIITFFGDKTLGLYAFTLRLMKLPLGMIGTSIGQVFFQKAADTINSGENLYLITLKVIKKLTLISLPIFILIAFFANWGFEFVFGKEWAMAGKIAQIFTPWMFFHFLNSPLSQIPLITNKQKEIFFISIIGFLLGVSSLIYGGLILKEVYQSLLLFSLIQSFYLLFVLLWILKTAKNFSQIK